MTTTIMFSGKEGKNSSKVLANPGGNSTLNLFGGGEETPAPARTQRKVAENPIQHTTPKAQDSGPAKPFRPVCSINPVTGEPNSYAQPRQRQQPPQQQAQPQAQAPPPPQQQQQQSAPPPQNPQAAAPEASALPQQVTGGSGGNKTSVKIYNPPGGRSSIQF